MMLRSVFIQHTNRSVSSTEQSTDSEITSDIRAALNCDFKKSIFWVNILPIGLRKTVKEDLEFSVEFSFIPSTVNKSDFFYKFEVKKRCFKPVLTLVPVIVSW